jgi:cytoskeletal protein CcmA (bactofilin family)
MALFGKEPDRGLRVQSAQPGSVTNSHRQPNPSGSGPETFLVVHESASALADQRSACLGRNSKVIGKLAFAGSVRVDGEIDGEIAVKDSLHIGETGILTAEIKAASIVVGGRVSGNITGSQKIELRSSAKVLGNLMAPVVVIQEGAQFEGHCSMPGRENTMPTVPENERVKQAAQVFAGEQRPVPAKIGETSTI